MSPILKQSSVGGGVLAGCRQSAWQCLGLRARGFPAQAGQPDGTWNGFVRSAVVAHHAAADTQCFGSGSQRQIVTVHPVTEHFVADFARLLLGPGIDIVLAKFAIEPLDATAPLGDVSLRKNLGIKNGGECRDLAQQLNFALFWDSLSPIFLRPFLLTLRNHPVSSFCNPPLR